MNYTYRMHDPRIGRFFAIDPLAPDYPWNSPYAFSENVVIDHIELEGLEKAKPDGSADYSSTGGVHPSEYAKQQSQQPSSSTIPLGSKPLKPLPLFNQPQSTSQPQSTNQPNVPNTSGFSNDVDFGVQLITSKIQGAAQLVVDEGAHKYTEVTGVARDAHLPAAANIAKLAGTAGNIYSIGDKVLDTYNAFEREDYGQASRDATVATGYAVVTAMMLAPTGVSQIAGGLLFIAFAIYDAVND